MVPAFKSAHVVVVCQQCGFEFACDAVCDSENRPTTAALGVICGNCGCAIRSSIQQRSRQTVQLSVGESATRFDAVAFKHQNRMLIKRVIGLPRETVNFRDGNLIINNKIIVKPEALWADLSAHVYDSTPPKNNNGLAHADTRLTIADRLVPRAADHWKLTPAGLQHLPTVVDRDKTVLRSASERSAQMDLLDYRHWRTYKSSHARKTPTMIEDSYPFNQSVRRALHPVDELDVSIKVSVAGPGALQIERFTGVETITALIDFDSACCADIKLTCHTCLPSSIHSSVVQRERNDVPYDPQSTNVRIINYDNQVRLLFDQTDCVKPIDIAVVKPDQRTKMTAHQPVLTVGVSPEAILTVNRLLIRRDWYLFQETAKPNLQLPLTLGADEYFVVGDNLAVSEDSRSFGPITATVGVVTRASQGLKN